MSLRQTIIDALVVQLKTITTANGYNSNAGSNVFVWRRSPVNDDELPCLLVNDNTMTRDGGAVSSGLSIENSLAVSIVAAVASSTSVEDARDIELDLAACLYAFDPSASVPGWFDCTLRRTTLAMEQHDTATAAISAEVAIRYYSNINAL